jgi:hypothetical protein
VAQAATSVLWDAGSFDVLAEADAGFILALDEEADGVLARLLLLAEHALAATNGGSFDEIQGSQKENNTKRK